MSRSNSSNDVSPESLAGLDEEQSFIKKRSNDVNRIKIKKGESVKVRFLPAQLGPQKRWYARLAKHWSAMKPITCLKLTHPDYGGDPDCICPVCEVADALNASHSKEVSTAGYKLSATAQWLTYCLLFAKSDGGPFRNVPEDEIGTVYVYDHYKSTYEELVNFVRNGTTEARPMSVLDYTLGNDFVASKTGNGTRLDKQDPEAVFDPESPDFEAFIQSIEAQMVTPKIIIPSDEELQEFADKAHELAIKSAHSGGGGGGRGRSYGGFNEADDHAPADDREAHAEEREPASAPRRGAAPSQRTASPSRQAPATAPARSAAPAPARAAAPAPAARTAPAPARAAAPAPARSAAPAPVTRRGAPAPAAASSVDADEEHVPEEGHDSAPPVDEPLEEAVDAGELPPEEGDAGEEQPPTPTPPARPSALDSTLKSKIAAAKAQELRR